MKLPSLDFQYLRNQIVGVDSSIDTPFGKRLMVYCDFTASGRCLKFIEHYLMRLQRHYANTHTEDDVTGRNMTQLLCQAEKLIKDAVNAGPNGRIIACGHGCTGAIDKFQQLVGVALTPVTRQLLMTLLDQFNGQGSSKKFHAFLQKHQPVIFLGSYEHHSNEVTWREGMATVVKVRLNQEGSIDLNHLETLLQKQEYQNRLRIGSFSAASNVTGMITPVREISMLLHQYDALACFDYAASAPYVEIDMNPRKEGKGNPSIDAVFISPHKYLGGPGSSGVLVFNERIYHKDLSPSVGGGGTVDYVSPYAHDFIRDIEEREKAGTPGVLQTMKAAMAFQVKEAVGVDRILMREHELIHRAFEKWKKNPNIEILGNQNPEKRVAIISFVVKDPWGRYLHPKFLTVLLNDLFGIQSRAGCSCAGPYGHLLLDIDEKTSEKYRQWIAKGHIGIKPGWCRIGFHYIMDDLEADYVIEAVDFIGTWGYMFLSQYKFDMKSALWVHKKTEGVHETFSLNEAFKDSRDDTSALSADIRESIYDKYLRDARKLADKLSNTVPEKTKVLEGELGELQFFSMIE
jgi:selenocysteine lyase/cysteine desulfurase